MISVHLHLTPFVLESKAKTKNRETNDLYSAHIISPVKMSIFLALTSRRNLSHESLYEDAKCHQREYLN